MIVLTGGAGFIGSCFLWKLNQEGINDILVVDELDSSEKWKNLVGKKFKDYLQKDDFLELIKQNKISGVNKIVHMGACSSTTLTDSDHYIKNNYEYSKSLAQWALSKGAKFLYASSAATYGDGANGYSDSLDKIYSLKPLNMYGYSKHMFDLWAIENKIVDKVTGIKFFNVYGPNEYHKEDMRSIVCKTFSNVKEKGQIELFKSYKEGYAHGDQKRDFIYIKDAVEVMYYLFCNSNKTGIFNLGTGVTSTWNDIANAMFKALNKKPNIKYIEMPDYLKSKYQYCTQAEMSKLREVGCNHEFMPLEDAIADYVGYLSEGNRI